MYKGLGYFCRTTRYLIDRENVQATVFEKPKRAAAIVISFWIMVFYASGVIGPFSQREKVGMREICLVWANSMLSPSHFDKLSTCLNPLPMERT